MSTERIVLVVIGAMIVIACGALVAIALWPWRVEATAKATTNESAVALGGGLDVVGLSASVAAILGGPGVIAVHFRGRERWRRTIACVTADAFFDWLDQILSKPETPPGFFGRVAHRIKDWLLARTDTSELPELGLRVVLALRELSFRGTLLCGFADPVMTGKTAAVLYPLAGVLAPFGELDVSFDWTGKSILDGAADVSFRVVPARVLYEIVRFARRNVRFFSAPSPSRLTA